MATATRGVRSAGSALLVATLVASSCSQPESGAPASQAQPAPASTPAQPSGYRAVSFVGAPDGKVTVGAVELELKAPDGPNPKAWEGPLVLRLLPSGNACEAEPSLVTAVFLDTAGHTALVQSYSGSMTYLDFIDVATCKPKWMRIEAFTSGVTVEGDRVSMLPGCEGEKSKSRCSAGRVLALSSEAAPHLLGAESRQLTKSRLGVEFDGEAWVQAPGEAGARVLPSAQ